MSNDVVKGVVFKDSTNTRSYGLGGVLAHSFRLILLKRQIDEEQWVALMDRFITSELGPNADRAAMTSLRGNLRKELAQPILTWKTYMKGLRVLGFTTIDFVVMGSGDDFTMEPVGTHVTMNSLSGKQEADGE